MWQLSFCTICVATPSRDLTWQDRRGCFSSSLRIKSPGKENTWKKRNETFGPRLNEPSATFEFQIAFVFLILYCRLLSVLAADCCFALHILPPGGLYLTPKPARETLSNGVDWKRCSFFFCYTANSGAGAIIKLLNLVCQTWSNYFNNEA